MTTIAILPVKRFDAAKQRLDGELSAGTRRALAEAMITDVLVALRRTTRVDSVIVVTGEPAAEALAVGYGAWVITEREDHGHSEAALLGVAEAVERGADRVLLVPGDCPALRPEEVDELVGAGGGAAAGPEVVIVPDRHGSGTNALLLTPPDVIEPAFGPGSRERHELAATAAGVACEIAEIPTLAIDVDTAEDLTVLRSALAERRGGAAHTRGLLSRLAGFGRPPNDAP